MAGEEGGKDYVTKCPLYCIKESGLFPKGPDVTLENFKQDSKLIDLAVVLSGYMQTNKMIYHPKEHFKKCSSTSLSGRTF